MNPNIPMVNGASAALAISDIPWNGPIAAVRVAQIDGQFVANPTVEQMFQSTLDLIYVGNEKDMLMIEGSADQIEEARFIEALAFGHQAIQPIIKAIRELVALCGRRSPPSRSAAPPRKRARSSSASSGTPASLSDLRQGKEHARHRREDAQRRSQSRPCGRAGRRPVHRFDLNVVFEDFQYKAYRRTVLERGVRADGRDAKIAPPDQLRGRRAPRVHGSALFQRGDTQSIVLTTLGPTKEAQDLDALTGGVKSKSFILHYNFPPFSVGETGRFGAPGRREVGHGALVSARSCRCCRRGRVPLLDPRRLRDHGLHGSTSMASICGGCLSLMDAGVPIIAPVAGISCGLMTENAPTARRKMGHHHRHSRWEDHFGDMDFKLAGTNQRASPASN